MMGALNAHAMVDQYSQHGDGESDRKILLKGLRTTEIGLT
jgi:hypothetical protein